MNPPRPAVTLILVALLSGGLHWGVGWEATVVAGLVGGVLSPNWHWFVGAAGGALGWGGSVVYSAAAAPPSFRVLLDVLGALGGNIPGEAIVGLTVCVGAVLGGLGGGLGHVGRLLVRDALRSAGAPSS